MHKDAHITVGYDNKNMTQKHFSKLFKLLKNFFSFYLKQKKKAHRSLPSAAYFPKACEQAELNHCKARSMELVRISHVDTTDPTTSAITCCLLGQALARSWNEEQGQD